MTKLCNGLVVFAGLLAVPPVGQEYLQVVVAQEDPSQEDREDPRLARLEEFFRDMASPIGHLAADFITAADLNNLDWRLLPSISVIESGAGKDYRNNNIFGWDSCRASFDSVREGIHTVARRLSHSRLYKHKNLDALLQTYNADEDYATRVKTVMEKLGPPDLGAVN